MTDNTKKPLSCTDETYRHLDNENQGICTRCRYAQDGVEPDARGYNCEGCEDDTGKKNRHVYGTAELLIMGALVIVDEPEDETVKY